MNDLRLHELITDTAGAARLLGCTESRVRQLDDVLRPLRLGARGFRVYSISALSAAAAKRDAARAAKEHR